MDSTARNASERLAGLFPGRPHRSRDTCTRIPQDGRATAIHPWAHGSGGRLPMYEWGGARKLAARQRRVEQGAGVRGELELERRGVA